MATPSAEQPWHEQQVLAEQAYLDSLFQRLDEEVLKANERLREVMANEDPANPKAEALLQRETEYHGLNERIDRLNLAQMGLVFGRIDVATENPEFIDNPVEGQPGVDRRYIGRMGLDDREDDYRTLLLDWRAPLARPFYLATTAHPEGVSLRRHIRTKGRRVTGFDDEWLGGLPAGEDDESAELSQSLAGEGALFRTLQAARTEHMSSIVETIQREQDEIIRDATRGIMVVEGGPGTGKTAVALHRVAYLLYTWREQLARTGVLIIGPNHTFLDYISRVLPELGETGVVLSTIGDLFPGIRPKRVDSLLAREIKGSAEMVTILDRLVKHHQSLPEAPREVIVDGISLLIDAHLVATARTRARRSRRPHNHSQATFKDALAEQLALRMAEKIGADPLGGRNLLGAGDVAQLHDDLLEEDVVAELVDEFWPILRPTELLGDLLSSRELIDTVAYDYDEETHQALYRPWPTAWSTSDTALLDELAVLLGASPEEDADTERSRKQAVEDAQDVLDALSSSDHTDNDDETDAEYLSAFDVIDAEALAERHEEVDTRSTAERARADIAWTYGHVIVDEAQELTAMEWRMVMRRCPSRWMTLVGDIAQTGSPAGVDSWEESLEPFVSRRFKKHQLSVNYRTPAEVMEKANEVLAHFATEVEPSTSLRSTGIPVEEEPLPASEEAILQRAREIASGYDSRRMCVLIAADERAERLRDKAADLEIRGVSAIKGLEFDHVILVSPAEIVEASPQGWQDLFVSMTRATQTLYVLGASSPCAQS